MQMLIHFFPSIDAGVGGPHLYSEHYFFTTYWKVADSPIFFLCFKDFPECRDLLRLNAFDTYLSLLPLFIWENYDLKLFLYPFKHD